MFRGIGGKEAHGISLFEIRSGSRLLLWKKKKKKNLKFQL